MVLKNGKTPSTRLPNSPQTLYWGKRALELRFRLNSDRMGGVAGWFDGMGRKFVHCELAARSGDPVIPWREPVRAARQYAALKPDDVKTGFAQWIRPEDRALKHEALP